MGRWGELDPTLTPVDALASDGTPLRAWTAGTGDAALVLLHGVGWDHSLWAGEIARFRERCRIVAVDLRGHGASGTPAGAWSIEQLADDLQAVLAAVPTARLVLAGFSLGGTIALAAADTLGDRLSGLVLIGCNHRRAAATAAGFAGFTERMRALGPAGFAEAQGEVVFGPRFRSDHPAEVSRFVTWRTAMPIEFLFGAMGSSIGFDGSDILRRLSCPVQVIAAEHDPFVEEAELRRAAELCGRGRLDRVADSGHHVMVEQPQAFAALFDPFVADALARSP